MFYQYINPVCLKLKMSSNSVVALAPTKEKGKEVNVRINISVQYLLMIQCVEGGITVVLILNL